MSTPILLTVPEDWEPIPELSAFIASTLRTNGRSKKQWAEDAKLSGLTTVHIETGFPGNTRSTLKALNALGYTLAIVPLPKSKTNGAGKTKKKK